VSGRLDFRSARAAMPLHDLIAGYLPLARAGGVWTGRCPYHQDKTPSFTVYPDHWICYGCGARGDGVDFLRRYLGISAREAVRLITGREPLPVTPLSPAEPYSRRDEAGEAQRIAAALARWASSRPIPGTLAERYLIEQRGLPADVLEGREHCLRWHSPTLQMIALMVDPVTDTPCGIHRIALDRQGRKLSRKMLGKAGVVMLSPSAEVTTGLGITEGVEDGLSIVAGGWTPVWACLSAVAVARFPLLDGIEALTIFADADPVGMKAAESCITRWHETGREAFVELSGGPP